MVKTLPSSIHPKSRAEWRNWLFRYKKSTGKPRFEYEEAVEEAS